ncbi:MAG: VWA domain-containing protein [Phycisphaerales bacterium]|nr:VWA domain-containing protein [Phycisphaerales bacterium]
MEEQAVVEVVEDRGARLWLWARRATVAGLAASVLVHLFAGVLAALWTVRYSSGDSGGSGSQVVDFAVMTEAELAELSNSQVQVSASHAPDVSAPNLSDLELESESSGEIDALTRELVEVDLSAGGGDVMSGGSSDASPGGGGLSGDGASFFGLEAQGSRFAYIVDVSSSMRAEGRMDRTKQELVRSITALAETSEVVIVLYSNGPIPLTGQVNWDKMEQRNKLRLRRLITEIEPSGSTYPLGAFEQVLKITPSPDAIYFMTDGEFDAGVPAAVRSLNGRPRVPIHCIMFGDIGNAQARAEVEDMLRRISRESGGRFKHVGERP